MKRINPSSLIGAKCTCPNDFHWKLFDALLTDLGLTDDDLIRSLRGAIRNRSIDSLFDCLGHVELRCISSRGPQSNAFECFRWGQVLALLKKFPFTGRDTKTPALEAFSKAESTCLLFNTENFRALEQLDKHHPSFYGIIQEIRDDIYELLKEVPSNDSIFGSAVHGPGVSIGDSYRKGHVTCYYKYAILPYTVTRCTLPYARDAISSDPRWIGALMNKYRSQTDNHYSPIDMEEFWSFVFEVVDGNRITTVPKNAKTDRVIAIEPLMNVYLQLGVGSLIQTRLLKWGYDLNDQSRNISLAKEGSITGLLSTLDLSAASDSIALKICELLLPPLWYNLLLDLRSPSGTLGKKEIVFNKISSMGNGFTFALETLIFGALARCAIRRTKSKRISAVYGDDIIVPQTATAFLIQLLNLCGFSVNQDKSFTEGPFRESCGGDFFLGQDVRPIYLKRYVESFGVLFYVHNSFFRLEGKLPPGWCLDFGNVLDLCLKYIPRSVRKVFNYYPSDSLDTYLFSSNPSKMFFRFSGRHYRCHYQIQRNALTFNGGTDFYMRKLMVSLKGGHKPIAYRVDRSPSSGNAFDVTKRDHTRETCVRVEHTDVCSLPTSYHLSKGKFLLTFGP